MDLEKLAKDFEAQEPKIEIPQKAEGESLLVEKTNQQAIVEQSTLSVGGVVGSVQKEILGRAQKKINQEKMLDKHADNIAKITDKAIEVDAERASLQVQEQEADNKVRKQEIRNKLIVLKAEAERLEKEQKQLNKEQKADHKARDKQAKWELYKDKLQKMHYSYVPNVFVLSMLLFFDGVRSFFDGLGTVSTAIVKALKWVILIGVILIILFSIPVTREWLINLFSGG